MNSFPLGVRHVLVRRKFLIAYNVNLLGTKEQAHRIALNVREQGRSKDEVKIKKRL